MSRDVPYDIEATCDICGKKGAFDFMGDYVCEGCSCLDLQKPKEARTP